MTESGCVVWMGWLLVEGRQLREWWVYQAEDSNYILDMEYKSRRCNMNQLDHHERKCMEAKGGKRNNQ